MSDRTVDIHGVNVPRFLYGTAWKEERTQPLTELALQQEFRGIDTANQRRHYVEAAVGEAVANSIASGLVKRDELFLQTKFTFRGGQDHRLPYEAEAPVAEQVAQSFASSLEHLKVDWLDSYVLHGPTNPAGLTDDDWATWRTMEQLHEEGKTRLLGVSNFSVEQLESLCNEAHLQPHFVQNRCFAVAGWDHSVRQFCNAHGIVYQGFSLLTANQAVLASNEIAKIAANHDCTVPQIVFRFALELGMIPLTGTTSAEHMRKDLDVFDFRLDTADVELLEQLAVR